MFEALSFRYPFRRYQRMILAQAETDPGDGRYHIVAPPGSGKTIVGLELIRRFEAPAVVFAPTTTIQRQWQAQLGMFTSDPAAVDALSGLDPDLLAPISIFTYQLISTPGEAQEAGRQMARRRWIDELLAEGQAVDETAAQVRLATLERNNPRAYEREVAQRYLRLKRELLRGGGVDVAAYLHPNARRLVDTLVAHGVRTVVLDECHHLLDYWAIVLRHLIGRIAGPRVIGLTATLPSPDGDEEYENYTSLLGDVDFEVPTPAVVKEGDLAPYRDFVAFVEPSGRERAYLHGIQRAFEEATAELTGSEAFRDWVARLALDRLGPDGAPTSWADFLDAHPFLSIAALRFLRRIGRPIPADLLVPRETEQDLGLDDWIALLECYALDVLKVSPEPADHLRLRALRRTLLPFGLTITERGLRQGRSPGDLVLALSEAKDDAVVRILVAESAALGDRLRAVAVTDFERMTTGVRRVRDVLDRDAGSARRVFHHLLGDGETARLRPVLVTGRTLMIGADSADRLLARFGDHLRAEGRRATCAGQPTADERVIEVVGDGPDWSSGTYVRMVTAAFEAGETRCLVGTRGIFGEGWDALRLNTLIDLTSVTTSTSVQQLRGRTIRLDPAWPRKVAHNWDVVCVAPDFRRGDADLRRFEQRHARFWGIVTVPQAAQLGLDVQATLGGLALGPDLDGAIVKGVSHVDPELAWELGVKEFRRIDFARYGRRMLGQVAGRERDYDRWRVGEEYSNFSYATTRLRVDDLKIRTVYTVQQTLKRMLRAFRASVLGGLATAAWLAANLAGSLGDLGAAVPVFGAVLAVGTFAVFALNLRSAYRLARAMLVDQPPDGILLDVGRALVGGLKDAGLISRNLQADYVRVVEEPDQSYQVLLDYASPEDAATFIRAYREVFAPVRDQRYLILRTDARLPSRLLGPAWAVLRRAFRSAAGHPPAYHPVPAVLATRRELAEAFARQWRRYVGGGLLVLTRSEEGRRILLEARAQRRPNVRDLAFEVWR